MVTGNTLYPFQEIGARWLATPMPDGTPHKALFDDPGLGKTVQVCAALKIIKAKSALIVTPPPNLIKQSWARHLVDWGVCKAEDVYVVKTSIESIPATAKFIVVSTSLLTYVPREGSLTYKNKSSVYQQVRSRRFDVAVIDEADQLQALGSKRSELLLATVGKRKPLLENCKWKWFLTGTPGDRPIHMYPILSTCAPQVIEPYETLDQYGRHFCGGKFINAQGEADYRGATNIPELRERLKQFAMRRTLRAMFPDIPETVTYNQYIDIGDLPGGEDITNTAPATLRKLIGIAKIPYLVEWLEWRLKKDNEKVLVLTFHRDVSEQLSSKLNCPLIYGGMNTTEKDAAFDAFTNGTARVLVGQMQSIGVGLNELQYATRNIIHAEPDWSGKGYVQQIGRLLRHGQDKTVQNTVLIAVGSYEEKIFASCRNKIQVMGKVLKDLDLDLKQNTDHNKTDLLTEEQNNDEIGDLLMSLEQQLTDLTAQVKLLTETISSAIKAGLQSPLSQGAVQQTVDAANDAKGKGKGKGKAENGASDAAVTTQTTASASTAVAGVAPVSTDSKLLREDVRKAAGRAITALGGASEENKIKISNVMQMFGVKLLDELPEAMFPKAIEMYAHLERGTVPGTAPSEDLGI